MSRVRLVILGLLLLASAIFFLIYQYSDSSMVRTRILPSRTLSKNVDRTFPDLEGGDSPWFDEDVGGVEVMNQGGEETMTVSHEGDDSQLLPPGEEQEQLVEQLGDSPLAKRLQEQALRNQREAARLREQRRKIDAEIFNLKVEKGRQAGVELQLVNREKNLKVKEKALQEERTRLSEERIFGRPLRQNEGHYKKQRMEGDPSDPKSSASQNPNPENYSNTNKKLPQKVHRNPLSVQGANLKNYLKDMSKNFYKNKGMNLTEHEQEKPGYIQELKRLQQNPEDFNNNNTSTEANQEETGGVNPMLKSLKKLDKTALAKLPMIERLVEQGHFGYEHGKNGKGSSRERKADTAVIAEAVNSTDRNKTSKAVPEKPGTPAPKSNRGWINNKLDDIWEGLEPHNVARVYPGIMLSGSYMLRRFIDPDDPRASGMEGKPHDIDDISEAAAEERFYQLVTGEQMNCADIQRLGNYGDGGWDMCVSGPYKPKHDCLVYSFGINNDFSFDDGISNRYGCEVKAFDPSMSRPDMDNGGADMNVGDHMHSSKVHFFNLGLGAADGINSQAWQLRTFGSILKRLGHDTRIIDFLKIDIEFNEWSCFKTMLKERSLKNVKQLVFEIHTSEVYTINKQSRKENFLEWYNTLLGLEKQGFRRYHHHYNPNGQYTSSRTGKERTCCYELYYVNIRFLK